MSFAELDLVNELLQTDHGSTEVDINIQMSLAQKNSDIYFDLFLLETPADISCYKYVIWNQDWTYSCPFLMKKN